jgi:predicted Zn-dependent peptidase
LTQSMLGCEMLGLGWEYGETFPKRIQSVTAAQIQEAAEKYLTNPAIAVLRPSVKAGAEAIVEDDEDDDDEDGE